MAAEMNRLQGTGYAPICNVSTHRLDWEWPLSPASLLNYFYSCTCP